jgi:hypothetical protein
MVKTEGRKLLLAAVTRGGRWNQTSLAAILEIGQSSISDWVTARSRPDAVRRDALSLILGIPQSAWLSPKERKLLERIATRFAAPSDDSKSPKSTG